MADHSESDEWFVRGEDGCLTTGTKANSVIYHPALNVILLSTKKNDVVVVDVTSGCILQKSNLCGTNCGELKIQYVPMQERLVFCDGYTLGARKQHNGILLLDTALQTAVSKMEEDVTLEISLPEANHLFKLLMSTELPGVDYVEEVLRELEKEIETVQQATQSNHKRAKWATVPLHLPHCTLKSVCSNLVTELKRLQQHVPGLPVVSALNDRLSFLLHNSSSQLDAAMGTVDRSQMYSEATRRDTFNKWPHMNYKWALPDSMAQAGFYHQPSVSGDDRAMCFTCNVCLVCWEPTDEPWSEHERHSPACPYVKGEYTQNVPMAATYASEPGQYHGTKDDEIEVLSTTSSKNFIATSGLHGDIVLWNITRQLKKHHTFNIDPWDPVIMMKTGSRFIQNEGEDNTNTAPLTASSQSPHHGVKHAWEAKPTSTSNNNAAMDNVVVNSSSTNANIETCVQAGGGLPATEEGTGLVGGSSNHGAVQASVCDYVPDSISVHADSTEHVQVDVQQASPTPSSSHNHSSSPMLPTSLPPKLLPHSVLMDDEDDDIPLQVIDMETNTPPTTDRASRGRPSPDVLVSSLSILESNLCDKQKQPAPSHSDKTTPIQDTGQMFLISGVSIRRNVISAQEAACLYGKSKPTDPASEVMTLNQVNQALSDDLVPQIIDQPPGTHQHGTNVLNPFVSYLLVYDIKKLCQSANSTSAPVVTSTSMPPTSGGQTLSSTFGTKLTPYVHDYYMPQILEMSEEDPLMQVTDIPSTSGNSSLNNLSVGMLSSSSPGIPMLPPALMAVGKAAIAKKMSSTINKSSSNSSTGDNSYILPTLKYHWDGQVMQCIELPSSVNNQQVISSIVPTPNNKYVVVITTPRHDKHCRSSAGSMSTSPPACSSPAPAAYVDHTTDNSVSECSIRDAADASKPPVVACSDGHATKESCDVYGCVMVYRVSCQPTTVSADSYSGLKESPEVMYESQTLGDTIKSIIFLPKDITQSSDDEDCSGDINMEYGSNAGSGPSFTKGGEASVGCDECPDMDLQMAAVLYSGEICIIRLSDLKFLSRIPVIDNDKFVSITFCSGVDSLCACTESGKLHFYAVGPCRRTDYDSPAESIGLTFKDSSDDSVMDTVDHLHKDDVLAYNELTTETLVQMYELTQFEALVPRFTATVPPCWTEVQQEQQQRRHPQHLQQQGEATQHTRTWKLQQDSTSFGEHMIELVIPKSCSVGHIDLKFSLHPLCTSTPNIHITLLKQSTTKIGYSGTLNSQVDAPVNFNIFPTSSPLANNINKASSGEQTLMCYDKSTPLSQPTSAHITYDGGLEVLCGPVDLAYHVDLSGTGGIVTLTSPQLINSKARAFIIKIKPVLTQADKVVGETSSGGAGAGGGGGASSSSKTKLDTVRGCDWLQEISITIRKSKKTGIARDRLQRSALLEASHLHEHLVNVACGYSKLQATTSSEHRQSLALDILLWIMAIQKNDPSHRGEQMKMIAVLQDNMKGLLQNCLLEGTRSLAHKCARIIILAMEYAKTMTNADLAPALQICVLNNLLDLLPTVCSVHSAGALHWFFILLNRVKCMDVRVTGHRCVELLTQVAAHYRSRANPLHSLLKSKFGLYGTPLEPALFDVDSVQLGRPAVSATSQSTSTGTTLVGGGFGAGGTSSVMGGASSAHQGTYATAVSSNNLPPSGATASLLNNASTTNVFPASHATAAASASLYDDQDFRDLISISGGDKSSSSSSSGSSNGSNKSDGAAHNKYIYGLLEVEPLHFSCHATSDGTRVERMDTAGGSGLSGSSPSGLSGTINFGGGEALPSAAGAALASLSSAMASAEHQLQMLQYKQQQLIKLQQQKQKLEQKLAETSKSVSSSSVGGAGTGGSSSVMGPGSTSTAGGYYNMELLPPTPKTTPLFMTPPVTPPNESYHQVYSSSAPGSSSASSVPSVSAQPQHQSGSDADLSKNQWKSGISASAATTKSSSSKNDSSSSSNSKSVSGSTTAASSSSTPGSQMQYLLQPPPPQVLVIERMHSGARRFVVLDFGRPILLTDVIIPACNDLASLSIDVWVHGEDVDGHRLIIASDIGIRSLILSDLLPPPVCRYVKITTIGRYGGSTTRSRIPIGSFYGHTTLLPWEHESHNAASVASVNSDRSQIMTQLATFLSLQEDVHCRYSLAAYRLTSLLSMLNNSQSASGYTGHRPIKGKNKRSEHSNSILQAYHDCVQLQLKLNLAQRAVERLQRALDISPTGQTGDENNKSVLHLATTDKLSSLSELLLDTILTMTYPTPSIPQLPASLYSLFTAQTCRSLFGDLCVHGTRRMQLHMGVLLVRLCGNQPWWGRFLGSMLHEYFSLQHRHVFPQDRVFVLLTVLGQKSLTGQCGSEVMESILQLLAKLLSNLSNQVSDSAGGAAVENDQGSLDLSLVSWVLLFLSRCLDSANDESDRLLKDKETSSNNRWDFLQGDSILQNSRSSSKMSSSKLYRRKLQKRLMHHKQQLMDLQQAKKNFIMSAAMEKASSSHTKESESALKLREKMFKKRFNQYSNKHVKDIMQIRRTDGETLRKLSSSGSPGGASGGESSTPEEEVLETLVVVRERCIPVVKGLVALLLNMDFTCNVDLFLVTCKVIAKLSSLTRPAISLCEMMTQQELDHLILLHCSFDFNHVNVTWGGPWAGHAVISLLQDILDGEKSYPMCRESSISPPLESSSVMVQSAESVSGYGAVDGDVGGVGSVEGIQSTSDFDGSSTGGATAAVGGVGGGSMEVDMCGMTDDDLAVADSLSDTSSSTPNSTTAPTAITTPPSVDHDAVVIIEAPSGGATGTSKDPLAFKYDSDSDLIMDMLLQDYDEDTTNKLHTYMSSVAEGSSMDHVLKAPSSSTSAPVGMNIDPATVIGGFPHMILAPTSHSQPLSGATHHNSHPVSVMYGGSGSSSTSAPGQAVPLPTAFHWGSASLFESNDDKKSRFEGWKSKMAGYTVGKSTPSSSGVSTAMDARLEGGIELAAELKLKLILAVESDNISNAITAALPLPPTSTSTTSAAGSSVALAPLPAPTGVSSSADTSPLYMDSVYGADEYHNTNATSTQLVSSKEMLSICFNHLFRMVGMHHINLDVLLSTWLMLNDDLSTNDNNTITFDYSKQPTITLNKTSVTCLLETLALSPYVSVSTWVLSFQALSLLANISCEESAHDSNSPDHEKWLSSVMVTDSNMKTVILRFLTGTAMNSNHYAQIGPTATQAFQNFLSRLYLRCAEDNELHLKKLLLSVVYTLSVDRGAFQCGLGPVDAQCRFIEMMLPLSYDNVDITDALSVTDAVSSLVHQHIMGQERVMCYSSSENSVSARSCFGGLFANILTTGDSKSFSGETSRDLLMSSLLRLVNLLVQIKLPERNPASSRRPKQRATSSTTSPDSPPITDSSKLSATRHQLYNETLSQPKSDEEKCSETDEQKRETAAAAANSQAASSSPTSCSHFTDCRFPEDKPATLTDMVLANSSIISHLLHSLATCNTTHVTTLMSGGSGSCGSDSSTSSCSSGSTLRESFANLDPVSVGDGVFQVLCTLNSNATDLKLILIPLLQYLRSGHVSGVRNMVSWLSEPLLWFLLRVLDCETSLNIFLEMGGVTLVCENLVQSNRYAINMNPSLVSSITHLLSVAKDGSLARRSYGEAETSSGLLNFAPLGTISSSSPTAGPADILIQASPPHRRARSAAWSYHFYPEEPWVDLTITLPSAIMLKEVLVTPHLPSLSTCPLAISLEVSCDGSLVVPVNCPVMTSGLTSIKLLLLKPEVVTAVTLRLHKPRDSATIGLTQILLLGSTAFSSAGSMSRSGTTEDTANRSSIGWLRLVHHCLSHCESVSAAVSQAASTIPNLLVTCTALLVSPQTSAYANSIEDVLLTLGRHSLNMGLALINNILRNTTHHTGTSLPLHGHISGVASEYTVDILHQLGMIQDQFTSNRVKSLLQWLYDCSQATIAERIASLENNRSESTGTRFTSSSASRSSSSKANNVLLHPAPHHVHCIAAVLWNSHQQRVNYDLPALLSTQLLKSLYEWSHILKADVTLKKSVDYVLCAMCYIKPAYFIKLLQHAGICKNEATSSTATPGAASQRESPPATATASTAMPHEEAMTDDSKEAAATHAIHLADLPNLHIDDVTLRTIACVCQSPRALVQLLHSKLPALLCQALVEYCNEQNQIYTDWLLCTHIDNTNSTTRSDKANRTSSRNVGDTVTTTVGSGIDSSRYIHMEDDGSDGNDGERDGEQHPTDTSFRLTADLVPSVLHFLSTISSDPVMKDWLGGAEGNVFWSSLLTLMCNTTTQASIAKAHNHTTQFMSGAQRSCIETATVEMFTNVISCHKRNQHLFATVLCDVIRKQGNMTPGSSNAVLSGFTRRLFLQVLLEDEKILVCVHNKVNNQYTTKHTAASISSAGVGHMSDISHPYCGAGRSYRTVYVNLQHTCAQVINKLYTDTMGSPIADEGYDNHGYKDRHNDETRDTNEMGIEMLNQMSVVAGLKVKEKREKTSSNTPGPRPPTRRGHRTSDTTGAAMPSQHTTPCLHHSLLPGITLPPELTLAQVLTLLHERGLPDGKPILHFTMRHSHRHHRDNGLPRDKRRKYDITDWFDGKEDLRAGGSHMGAFDMIPDEVVLNSAPVPSALQVFASVGGLALLAKHLPLLYPEITRQVSPPTLSRDLPHPVGVGLDWVNVEADEFYEDYEPTTSAQTSAGHQSASHGLPSIPPHSLVAFGLFLRLPGYADVLLKERKRAQCLLRLVLGVTDDGEGGHILTSPVASSLPTLPFNVLKSLFDCTPLTTDDGVLLRRMTLEIGAVHLVLACLSVLSHHAPRVPIPGFHQEIIVAATQAAASLAPTSSTTTAKPTSSDDKSQNYWAKGTGYGTGSTTSSWDAEQAMVRQRSEEEHVTCLLQVLSSYIYPDDVDVNRRGDTDFTHSYTAATSSTTDNHNLPAVLPKLLMQSCLVPSICSYLRNDSVLDMARHVPLYRAVLELLRAIALCPVLVMLLLPLDSGDDSSTSISSLLDKMKVCVDTYASRLKNNKGKTSASSSSNNISTSTNNTSTKSTSVASSNNATTNGTINSHHISATAGVASNSSGAAANKIASEEEEAEGLALLIPDIQNTATICARATARLLKHNQQLAQQTGNLTVQAMTGSTVREKGSGNGGGASLDAIRNSEQRYMKAMKELQFDTYEMITDTDGLLHFNLSHRYESIVKAAGEVNNASRARRLAQETVTLSTSLPLSASSSVFVRCDEDHLDVMKVLITGPSDTPYANGCFEFDVYFPQDYPNSPPLINLETTGNHTVRFNPNLYNDGKVCLSILNTWHGRPEEKWNAQTSSFLQVLVSIQSLILVSEPYFNEPGYERSRGTPSGTASSWEYDANIRQATAKWAMLEQLRNPSPCFKEVVEKHFFMKRKEILAQIDEWISSMEVTNEDKRSNRTIGHSSVALKRHYTQLKNELERLKNPDEEMDDGENATLCNTTLTTNTAMQNSTHAHTNRHGTNETHTTTHQPTHTVVASSDNSTSNATLAASNNKPLYGVGAGNMSNNIGVSDSIAIPNGDASLSDSDHTFSISPQSPPHANGPSDTIYL